MSSSKDESKPAKAKAPAGEPWFRKKRFTFPLALLLVVGLYQIPVQFTPGQATWFTVVDLNAAPKPSASPSDDFGDVVADDVDGSGDFFYTTFGEFEAVEFSGTGDGLIELPDLTLATGIAEITHSGSGDFEVVGIDVITEAETDNLVKTSGDFSGMVAYGLFLPPTQMRVTASGDWTIRLMPMTAATELPESGSGPGVYRYDGAETNWLVTHRGKGAFVLIQISEAMDDYLIDSKGTLEETVLSSAGPSIVVVQAPGEWSITVE